MASASEQRTSFDGDAALDEVDDVGLGEDAALGGDVVELACRRSGGDVTSSGGALTLRKHLSIVAPVPEAHLSFMDAVGVFSPGLLVLLEHDDLGVLPAELDDRAHVGVQVLDREGDGVDLLDELAAGRARRAARRRSPVRNIRQPSAG